jgi:hypothetical protein
MTSVRQVFQDLVDRRLWPLAAALLVAVIAVPLLLSKPAKESQTPRAPASGLVGLDSAKLLGETSPVVSVSQPGVGRRRLRRLARKNPFVQQAQPQGAATGNGLTVAGGGAGGTAEPSPRAPSAPGTSPLGVSNPTGGGESQPTPRLFEYVVQVRFGTIGNTTKREAKAGDFLPSEKNPVVLSVGASDDGKNALFLVTSGATAHGDASCIPSEAQCEILSMKKGDTEFLEVSPSADTVATYELAVTDIELKEVSGTTSSQSELRAKARRLRLSARRLRQAQRRLQADKVFQTLDLLSGF